LVEVSAVKKIGNFQTEDKNRLSEQLDRFQEAVDQETQDIRARYMPRLEQRVFSTVTAITETLQIGQIGMCDSALGGVTVTLGTSSLRSPSPGWLAIVKKVAANTVTLKPSGSNDLGVARRINATTSLAIGPGTLGIRWVYFDGADWWG
jgi:hypothetical protein